MALNKILTVATGHSHTGRSADHDWYCHAHRGFSQLRCGLSIYHWQTVICLGWLSSVTHITTMSTLRSYFQKSQPVRCHAVRLWNIPRMVLIWILGTLLMIASFPANSRSWLYSSRDNDDVEDFAGGIPAVCFFENFHPGNCHGRAVHEWNRRQLGSIDEDSKIERKYSKLCASRGLKYVRP